MIGIFVCVCDHLYYCMYFICEFSLYNFFRGLLFYLRFRNDLYCVGWGVKLYTHSLTCHLSLCWNKRKYCGRTWCYCKHL